jgi:hypothetical protein
LCATNEKHYVINKPRKVESNFKTHDKIIYTSKETYPINKKYTELIEITNDVQFNWKNIDKINDDYFSFLEPIYLQEL